MAECPLRWYQILMQKVFERDLSCDDMQETQILLPFDLVKILVQ